MSEGDYLSEPIQNAPKREPSNENCNAKKKQKKDGELVRDDNGNALFAGYCGCWPGKGTDHVGEGRCSRHGGENSGENGQGAKEGNTNRVSHGAYADQSNLYSDVFTEAQREIADDIYQDYRDRYLETHGDIPTGHDIRLFKLSVNAVTEIRVENWETQKPEDLDSGTVLIDREEHIKISEGGPIREIRYKKTPALAAKKTLSNENRKWLKDLGLLDSPEDQQADAVESLAKALSDES